MTPFPPPFLLIRRLHRQPGFTLTELMAALLVVMVLAGLSWSSYQHAVLKARRAEGRAALLQVLLQQERQFAYQQRYQAFEPAQGVPRESDDFKWYSGGTPQTSAYALSARACDGAALDSCVLVTATPGGPGVHAGFSDSACGRLHADSRGGRSADGPDCW
ncbi:type IV pilin protein [Herbaspirillum seropedicae]|uniref:type IV pilin protein n=1 Tax=Herbaspirillum seropedicae TaxID=964 RepID=UPI000847FCF0|nr:type IV pilin protein [Herbaspirillum seropedicae]AON56009.1 type-4 fimbrial pilin-related transmembrane protein [Herbaspirillum seropedicae]